MDSIVKYLAPPQPSSFPNHLQSDKSIALARPRMASRKMLKNLAKFAVGFAPTFLWAKSKVEEIKIIDIIEISSPKVGDDADDQRDSDDHKPGFLYKRYRSLHS